MEAVPCGLNTAHVSTASGLRGCSLHEPARPPSVARAELDERETGREWRGERVEVRLQQRLLRSGQIILGRAEDALVQSDPAGVVEKRLVDAWPIG